MHLRERRQFVDIAAFNVNNRIIHGPDLCDRL